MKKKETNQVVKSKHERIIYLFLVVFMGGISYGLYGDIEGPLLENKMTFLLLLFGVGIVLYSLYQVLNPTVYEFSKEGIITKNRIERKNYRKRNIHGFIQESYKGKSSSGELIVIKTDDGYLKLDSNYFKNFSEISRAVHQNFKKLSKSEIGNYKIVENLTIQYLGGMMSFGTLALGIYLLTTNADIKDEIVWVEGKLEAVPMTEEKGGGRDDNSIVFKLQEHPEFRFLVTGASYRECSKAVFTDLRRGSEVELGMLITDYQNKFLKKDESAAAQSSLDWKDIQLYDIVDETGVYLPYELVRASMKRERQVGWVMIGVSIFFALLFIYSLKYGL